MEQSGATWSRDAAARDKTPPQPSTHFVLVDPIPPHQLTGSDAALARNHNRLRGGRFVDRTHRLDAAASHTLHCTNALPCGLAPNRKTEPRGK